MFVNVTPLCKLAGKEMNHWLENKSSQDLIKAVYYDVHGIQREDLPRKSGAPNEVIYKVMDGPNDLRGTYVHPDIMTHILCWCSPEFAIKASKIIHKYLILLLF
jgi:hypothetical protein